MIDRTDFSKIMQAIELPAEEKASGALDEEDDDLPV